VRARPGRHRPILALLDGSKALPRAMLDVFDRPKIGSCQLARSETVRIGYRQAALGGGDRDAIDCHQVAGLAF
jgi:hypothetical protein